MMLPPNLRFYRWNYQVFTVQADVLLSSVHCVSREIYRASAAWRQAALTPSFASASPSGCTSTEGDAALEALFERLRDALAPGGLLILEPQPWRSYRKALQKRGVCSRAAQHCAVAAATAPADVSQLFVGAWVSAGQGAAGSAQHSWLPKAYVPF